MCRWKIDEIAYQIFIQLKDSVEDKSKISDDKVKSL